ncbi:MAG: exodeoxyribonuclease VII small subunit [Deltaproteobacteria bacterium]|nr:MAG: exodeoxyribonuclease VII small subunit [Deltaproteobacteria bacterium]
MKFSEALARIQAIAEKIDRGEIEIDELAASVKEAYELHALCKKKIEEAELQIEKIIQAEESSSPQGKSATTDHDEADSDEGLPF